MTALAFRTAEPSDLAHVFETWIEGYRNAHAAGPIPMPMYRRIMRICLKWILSRPGVELWVAHHPGLTPETRADIHGWCCVEGGHSTPVVHYVYIKPDRRRNGVARELLASAGVDVSGSFVYTFKTQMVSRLRCDLSQAKWRPLVARYPAEPRN